MKKITTLVLSLVLVLAMSITAFAATNDEVIKALKEVNDVQAAEPKLDVEKFVNYIHRGTVK